MHTFLDISRLIQVASRAAPSGIDRVELAYARHVATLPERSRSFVAELPLLGFVALPGPLVRDLIAAVEESWLTGHARPARRLARQIRMLMPLGRGRLADQLALPGPKTLLVVSHRALERPRNIEAMRRAGCRFVPLIHDLIPLNHPEFARPGHAARHEKRITTAADLSDALIVNSQATGEEMRPWLAARLDSPRLLVAPLGVEPAEMPEPPVALRPYFVMLGTIEPRKNHLLLLHIWRQLTASLGNAAPRLIVIGRRGWENENILDLLERCPAFDGAVRETGSIPDQEVSSLLRGARALLFPSFAEGFGLPVAEALSLGVPVIASDLPVLREVAEEIPEYLDPLDGAAWRRAIMDYARPDSALRRAQVARMAGFRPPRWSDHFAAVDALLDSLADDALLRPARPLLPPLPQALPASRAPRRDRAVATLAREDGAP